MVVKTIELNRFFFFDIFLFTLATNGYNFVKRLFLYTTFKLIEKKNVIWVKRNIEIELVCKKVH